MTDFWILQTLNTLQYAALLFLISAGLSVSFGLMGFVNLAHGALYMLGAYLGIAIADRAGYWTALAVVPLMIGTIGTILYLGLLRRIERAGPMPQVLVSFGLIFMVVEIVRICWGDIPLTLDIPTALAGRIQISGAGYPGYRLFIIMVGGGLALALQSGISKTAFGAALRASVENPEMAQAIGIRTGHLFTTVFALGAALAGLGGVMSTPITSASTSMAISALIPALIVTVIGGIGSVSGTVLGALIVATVEVLGASFWPDASAVLIYAVLALALIWRPEGLLAARKA